MAALRVMYVVCKRVDVNVGGGAPIGDMLLPLAVYSEEDGAARAVDALADRTTCEIFPVPFDVEPGLLRQGGGPHHAY